LRAGFTVAPIAFGLDKSANLLTEWPGYLAPIADRIIPGTAQQAMYAVGVIEVMAGLLVTAGEVRRRRRCRLAGREHRQLC
jgi:hypothetical protein